MASLLIRIFLQRNSRVTSQSVSQLVSCSVTSTQRGTIRIHGTARSLLIIACGCGVVFKSAFFLSEERSKGVFCAAAGSSSSSRKIPKVSP